MSFPKQLNFLETAVASPSTLASVNNCFFLSAAGTYPLPPISGCIDGTVICCKNTSAAATCTLTPSGTDTIDGGATANIPLTAGGAGLGLGCILVARKAGVSTTWTWWRIVKAQ